jgi:hypothetical protein
VTRGSSNADTRIVVPGFMPGGRGFSILEEGVIGGAGLLLRFLIMCSGMPIAVAISLSI